MAAIKFNSSMDVRGIFREVFLVSFPFLMLCLVLDFFAGAVLGKFFDKLMISYSIILVVLPGLMGLRGNLYGALASRFTTMLHLGELQPSLRDPKITKNVYISILLSLLPVTVLWLIGAITADDVDNSVTVLLILVISTVFASIIMGYSTAMSAVVPFRKGVDPDVVAAPIVTSIGDLVTIPLLVGFVLLYEKSGTVFYVLFILAAFIVFIFKMFSKFEKNDKKMFVEISLVIGVLALFSSITGSLLENYSMLIHESVIFTVMYPSVLDSLGNLGSIIGTRTPTRIHLGEIKGIFDRKTSMEILLYTVLGAIIGFLANLIAILIVRATLGVEVGLVLPFIILYPFVAFVVMWLAHFIALISHKVGLDPDNATVPTITTIADLISTVFVVSVAHMMVNYRI